MNARIEALKAQTPEELRPYVSPESYIDAAIGQLISKGYQNLTEAERQEYGDLVQERADRMMPAAMRRRRERASLPQRDNRNWLLKLISF